MSDFSFASLRRFPDVEAENLQAWDATDEMLVARALSTDARGAEIAVVGDEYGAITLALVTAGHTSVRVHQDLATGRRALANNAEALGVITAPDATAAPAFVSCELGPELLTGARLVLLQLPKSLAELEEIADAVARWAAPDVVLVAGGRVKHMTLTQNEVLGRYFANVQAQRAARKSRLVEASAALAVSDAPPFPQAATHSDYDLTLVAHGGAFAASRIDIGTRVLLDAYPVLLAQTTVNSSPRVLDLGCGTGALAAVFARRQPDARVVATDRSAAAVRSARATMAANGVADQVTVTHDDAGSGLPDSSFDVVLLNPPFHLGATVHTGAATRLFEAAARLLRPGGELWTVFNSSLAYRPELTRLIGATEQISRTPKFTVTRSIRR